jgi:K+-transporting ATPase KdpF subunit
MQFLSWPVSASSPPLCSTPSLASICEERAMIFDYVLSGIVTIGIMVYLVYALIRPEKF